MEISTNYLAVLVAALANCLIGAIWYTALFKKSWQELSRVSEIRPTPVNMVLGILAALIMSWVLSRALVFANTYIKTGHISGGLMVGFFIWLSFIAPVTLGVVIYEKKSLKLWLFNNGYWLLSLLVMGVILSVFQVRITLVFAGDSQSSVDGYIYPTPSKWLFWLHALPKSPFAAASVKIAATAGWTSNLLWADYAKRVAPHRPVLAWDRAYLFVMVGINDVLTAEPDYEASYDNLKREWAAGRADGFTVVAFTVPKADHMTEGQELQRVALNTMIMSNPTLYDYVIRPDIRLADPANTIFFADGTHYTDFGAQIVAQAVIDAITRDPYRVVSVLFPRLLKPSASFN